MASFKELAEQKRDENIFERKFLVDDFLDFNDYNYNHEIHLLTETVEELNKRFFIPLLNYFRNSINPIVMIEKIEDIFPDIYKQIASYYTNHIKFQRERDIFYNIHDTIGDYVYDLIKENILSLYLKKNQTIPTIDEIMEYLKESSDFSLVYAVLFTDAKGVRNKK